MGRYAGKFRQGLAQELIVWAEAEFRRSLVRADGASDADHSAARNRIMQRLRGTKAKSSSPATTERSPPYALAYLWWWFTEILAGVPPNGMAPSGIGWRDLDAWMGVTGRRLHHWECLLMLRLSQLRAGVVSERRDKPKA